MSISDTKRRCIVSFGNLWQESQGRRENMQPKSKPEWRDYWYSGKEKEVTGEPWAEFVSALGELVDFTDGPDFPGSPTSKSGKTLSRLLNFLSFHQNDRCWIYGIST